MVIETDKIRDSRRQELLAKQGIEPIDQVMRRVLARLKHIKHRNPGNTKRARR